MKILKGKQPGPRRMMLYGDNGIGKSTLASLFPKPFMLNLEAGAGDVDVDKSVKLKSLTDFRGCISWLISNEHEYRSIIIDTADWLEGLIFKHVAESNHKPSIAKIPYGQGYDEARAVWGTVIDELEVLWDMGLHIVLTAHVALQKLNNPTGDSYNYYAPAFHEKTGSKIIDWCDEVLFMTTRVQTIKKDEGFGSSRVIGIGGNERVIYTTDVASHVGKNRLGMPPELLITDPASAIQQIGQYIKANQATGNVAGIVNEGSSKKPQTDGE